MPLKGWRLAALLLAALSLTMESAHVLELPQKLQYTPQMYSAVNTTLYRYFAIVGAFYQLGSLLASALLVYLVRKRRPSFAWTLAGSVCLFLAFGVWLAVVAPVNAEVAEALHTAPASVPELWVRLRARWEGGHAIGFVLQVIGLGALLWSVLVETDATTLKSEP